MSANVVAMPGYSVPRSQAAPVSEIVAMCEELLAEAQTGKLRALGVAKVVADPHLLTQVDMFSGPSPDRYCLIAAVSMLDHEIKKKAWTDE